MPKCPLCGYYLQYQTWLEDHLAEGHGLRTREIEYLLYGIYEVPPNQQSNQKVWYRGKMYRYSPVRSQWRKSSNWRSLYYGNPNDD